MRVNDGNIKQAVELLDSIPITGIDNMMKIAKAVQLITTEEPPEQKEDTEDGVNC